MANDYGLGAMTGVLPTIVVAGTATMMAERLFQRPQPARKRRKTRRTRRSRSFSFMPTPGQGNFSNLPF